MSTYLKGSPNGGVFAPANLNLYAYAWNNPVKNSDPDGTYARISRIGNSVSIVIPILFRNAGNQSAAQFQENVARFQAGIEKNWTGKFGKLDVNTHVQIVSEAEAREIGVQGGGLNVLKVEDASSYAGTNPGHATIWSADPATQKDGETISNFEIKGVSEEGHATLLGDASGETAAHEAGHLLGLNDNKSSPTAKAGPDKRNIMTQIGRGREAGARPSEKQVRHIAKDFCNRGCR